MRLKSLACGLLAVAWTSFLITAVARFDSANIAQWRDRLISPEVRKPTLSERLEAATNAIGEVSRRILMSAVVVADSTGTTDNALPLLVKVTNVAPSTEIFLTGLADGTTLTSGASIGVREWRINIADLANAQVVPPHGYLGPMTLAAELRDAEGRPISRIPVRLTWNAAAEPPSNGDTSQAAEKGALANALASAVDPQDQQMVVKPIGAQIENVVLPKPRPLKRVAVAAKTSKAKKHMAMSHKHRMPRRDHNPDADARWASGQLPAHSLTADPRAERQATLDRIFRDLFVAGKQTCSPAGARQGGQEQFTDNCSGIR